jgi:uncharacterized protein (TIGR02722 family)
MKPFALLASIFCVLSLAGCGNPPDAAAYVDPNGPHTVVNVEKLNIQDFSMASGKLVQSLLNSGALERAPQKPAILAISRIVNNTDQQFDTDMLTNNIRIALLNTGKIETTTTLGDNAQDPTAKTLADRNAFLNGQSPPVRNADYTLTGKVMMDKTAAGSTKQSSYIFYLALTDVRTGNAVWEDQQTITKQGRSSSIGW